MLGASTVQVPSCFLSSKMSYKKDFQVHRFGPLMNVGPFGLYSAIKALFPLGIHFISPLGTTSFLILQNRTEWPLFMQWKHVTIDCFNGPIDCFSGIFENDFENLSCLFCGLKPNPDFQKHNFEMLAHSQSLIGL